MVPVRVKVYGFVSQTRRRYILQSIFGLGYGIALLILWWKLWPTYRQNLLRADLDLPTHMIVTVAVLNQLPWILLSAAAIKGFEMWIVLRRFAQKEAEQLAKATETSP